MLSFVVGKCFWHFARPAIFDSQLLDQTRFLPIPHLHSTPPLGRFPSEQRHPVWYGKTRMVGYPMVKKIRRYVYSFWQKSRTWQTDGQTDRQTDTAWRHRPRLCIASRGKNRFCTSRERDSRKLLLYMANLCSRKVTVSTLWGGLRTSQTTDRRQTDGSCHKSNVMPDNRSNTRPWVREVSTFSKPRGSEIAGPTSMARIFWGYGDTTSRKRNSEFRPLRCEGPPRI